MSDTITTITPFSELLEQRIIPIRLYNSCQRNSLPHLQAALDLVNGDVRQLHTLSRELYRFGPRTVLDLQELYEKISMPTPSLLYGDEQNLPIALVEHCQPYYDRGVALTEEFATLFPSSTAFLQEIHKGSLQAMGKVESLPLWHALSEVLWMILKDDELPRVYVDFYRGLTRYHTSFVPEYKWQKVRLSLLAFTSPSLELMLQHKYEAMAQERSLRVYHYLSQSELSHYLTALHEYITKERSPYPSFRRRLKVQQESLEVLHDFYLYITQLITKGPEDLCRSEITYLFPFLETERERDTVLAYYMKEGSYPMFYILYCYFMHSPDRNEEMKRMWLGINGEKPHTLEACGERMGLSIQRILQLRNRHSAEVRRLLGLDLWGPYLALKGKVPAYLSPHLSVLHLFSERELLPEGVERFVNFFLGIVLEEEYELYHVHSSYYYVRKEVTAQHKVNAMFRSLYLLNERAARKGTSQPCSLPDVVLKHSVIPDDNRFVGPLSELLREIVQYDLQPQWIVPVMEEQGKQEKLSKRRAVEICFALLQQKGHSMSIEELYPHISSHKVVSLLRTPEHLMRVLSQCEEIKRVGTTDRFVLKGWEWSPRDPLVRSLLQLLQESDSPMTPLDLATNLHSSYPTITPEVVIECLKGVREEPVLFFENDLIGLRNKFYLEEYRLAEEEHSASDPHMALFQAFVLELKRLPELSSESPLEVRLALWVESVLKERIIINEHDRSRLQVLLSTYNDTHTI